MTDVSIKTNSVNLAVSVKPATLTMIGNAHIDPVWLWRWQEGYQEVLATFRSALDRMAEYPDFIFIASSAAYYEWIEQQAPEMFHEIQARVAEGRWGLVGGWWVEPDCNLPAGESLVRQGLYAQQYFKAKFGQIAHTGYNVDSFGHSAMLPQILLKSGLENYVFMRPSPHEKGLPGRTFWWESGDGSRVMAYRLPYEYCSWGKDLETHIQRCAAEIRPPFDAGMCFYGVGNHGGGPTRENLESIARLSGEPGIPRLDFGAPEDFFDHVRTLEQPLPVHHGDLQHHASGCYSAHSAIKRWNRKAENLLLAAEKFSTIAACLTGRPCPQDYPQAWKDILFNQFHDILAGSSLEETYADARDLYGEANAIASRGLNGAIQSIAAGIRIPYSEDAQPIVAFNPHAWAVRANLELEIAARADACRVLDETGTDMAVQIVRSHAAAQGRRRISFNAELPAMGYRVFLVSPGEGSAPGEPFQASTNVIENESLRLEIDPGTGWIRSLRDLVSGVEIFAGPAARPVVIDDPSDTWSHNVFRFDREIGCFTAQRVSLAEHGPVKSTLRVESSWGCSSLVQEFTLLRGSSQVEVLIRVDWHEQHKLLKLRFPLHLNFMRATHEIPYGVIERAANGDEEPIQSWLDVSGISRGSGEAFGLSLLNDGKYSADVSIRDIGLTVLRSPIYAHHIPVVPQPDGTYVYMDQGIQEFRYILLPHAGGWEAAGTPRRAAELNQPPVIIPASFHPDGSLPMANSFLSAYPENIVATVLKMAEDGNGLILRAQEAANTAADATISIPLLGREIRACFTAGEIKTFRIPEDPTLPAAETNLIEMDD